MTSLYRSLIRLPSRPTPEGGKAKDAGLYCVAFANEVTRRFDLSAGDVQVDSLDDLPLSEIARAADTVG
jgi:hypothetical protein